MPCLLETWLLTFLTHLTINTLIPTKCRELSKKTLREKPKRKTRLTHSQFSSFDFSNFSTLTLSIVTSLRGTLTKSLSHHTHICEKVIWCLWSSLEGTCMVPEPLGPIGLWALTQQYEPWCQPLITWGPGPRPTRTIGPGLMLPWITLSEWS